MWFPGPASLTQLGLFENLDQQIACLNEENDDEPYLFPDKRSFTFLERGEPDAEYRRILKG